MYVYIFYILIMSNMLKDYNTITYIQYIIVLYNIIYN